jgi:hypothetical protein
MVVLTCGMVELSWSGVYVEETSDIRGALPMWRGRGRRLGAPIVVSACYCNDCREAAQRLAASADLAPAAGADGGTVTHFLRIVRGSLLRGQGIADAWPNLVALMLFVLGVERIGDAALSHDAGLKGGAAHHCHQTGLAVMPTESLLRAKAGVGVNVLLWRQCQTWMTGPRPP